MHNVRPPAETLLHVGWHQLDGARIRHDRNQRIGRVEKDRVAALQELEEPLPQRAIGGRTMNRNVRDPPAAALREEQFAIFEAPRIPRAGRLGKAKPKRAAHFRIADARFGNREVDIEAQWFSVGA